MNALNNKLMELEVSQNEKRNFSLPSVDSDELSDEVLLMFILLRVVVFGICQDFLSLFKNVVLIKRRLRVFTEIEHAFSLLQLIYNAMQFVDKDR